MTAINLETLAAAGVRNPEKVYAEIALLGGFGDQGRGYFPTLDAGGLDAETQKKINDLLTGGKPAKGDK